VDAADPPHLARPARGKQTSPARRKQVPTLVMLLAERAAAAAAGWQAGDTARHAHDMP
jgi:hypothetical protein